MKQIEPVLVKMLKKFSEKQVDSSIRYDNEKELFYLDIMSQVKVYENGLMNILGETIFVNISKKDIPTIIDHINNHVKQINNNGKI